MKRKAIAYLRVSTDNQVGPEKYGLDSQRKDIDDYARTHDYEIIEYFVEEGVSGGKLERPQLDRILYGEVKNPPVDTVIVAKTDRLSRDIQYYYFIKLMLKKRNLEVVSVNEDYNALGPMASMMEAMIVSFAEFERQMITSRTSKGREIKASKGGFSGGKKPFGYDVKDNELIINEKEAEVVRFIFDNSDKSLRSLAKKLNEMEMFTTSGSNWYAAQVGYIRNRKPFYQGQYKYGDMDYVDGTHKAII